jgi:hypothetical protein
MDTKKLAALLDLKDDATEAEIEAKIKESKEDSSKHSKDDEETSEYEKRILTLETQLAVQGANASVDAAIRAGKLLPKQKEMAVKMALRDMGDFEAFIATQPDNIIEFGEKGSSSNTDINLSKFEPTASEIETAKSMKLWSPAWRTTLMKNKMAAEGVEIPANFGVEKEPATA